VGLSKTKRQKKETKKQWLFSKITDDWIFGEVLLISGAFIIVYAVNFHGRWFSPKTEDWAHFATYLSGTVGVTAVVATLIVLVRTLGQQQALIDSQDEMLTEQRRQIDQVEKQNRAFENSQKINLAYSSVKEISPALIKSFKGWPTSKIHPYQSTESTIYENFSGAFDYDGRGVLNIIKNPNVLICIFESCPVDEIESFVERFFRPIEIVYKFACDQIEASDELSVYFEVEMMAVEIRGHGGSFYFHCYQAFLLGKGDSFALKGSDLLKLKSDYSQTDGILREWQKIGELVASKHQRLK